MKTLIAAMILLSALVVWAVYQDDKDWDKYSAAHHCVVVGHEASSVAPTTDGKTAITPRKTIYRCDGGNIEIR